MRSIIEELYFGNIKPSERDVIKDGEYANIVQLGSILNLCKLKNAAKNRIKFAGGSGFIRCRLVCNIGQNRTKTQG